MTLFKLNWSSGPFFSRFLEICFLCYDLLILLLKNSFPGFVPFRQPQSGSFFNWVGFLVYEDLIPRLSSTSPVLSEISFEPLMRSPHFQLGEGEL